MERGEKPVNGNAINKPIRELFNAIIDEIKLEVNKKAVKE